MTLDERIQGLRLRALYRAVELGNASQVCRGTGDLAVAVLSLEEQVRSVRSGGLAPALAGCRCGRPPKHEERTVLGMALSLADVGSSTALRPAFAKPDTGGTEHDSSDSFDAPGLEVGMNGWPLSSTTAHGRSASSGRSRPVMPRAPSPSLRSSRRSRRLTAPDSSSASSCPPTERPAGSSSASSRTTAASSRASQNPCARRNMLMRRDLLR
jgi:hypothetical protein